jgi:hypothetical protein
VPVKSSDALLKYLYHFTPEIFVVVVIIVLFSLFVFHNKRKNGFIAKSILICSSVTFFLVLPYGAIQTDIKSSFLKRD